MYIPRKKVSKHGQTDVTKKRNGYISVSKKDILFSEIENKKYIED